MKFNSYLAIYTHAYLFFLNKILSMIIVEARNVKVVIATTIKYNQAVGKCTRQLKCSTCEDGGSE